MNKKRLSRGWRLALALLFAVKLALLFAAKPAPAQTAKSASLPPAPPAMKISDRFAPVDPASVRLEGFLGERYRRNAQVRLLGKSEEDMLGAFQQRSGGEKIGEHAGQWIYATTLAWASTRDQLLRAKLDRVVSALLAAQQPDGYLGTYGDDARWGSGEAKGWDVWVQKQNLSGLLAYAAHTGDKASLEAARRIGDLLLATFAPGAKLDLNERSAHQGMASGSVLEEMVLLYRATGDERYLDFARYIAEHWEVENGPRLLRLAERGAVSETAGGIAYEMLSCLIGLCELYRATGEMRYLQPALAAWRDIAENHLLITGSGSSRGRWQQPQSYPSGPDDEPGSTEVTTAWLELNHQLLRLTGEARYADEIEKTIYNHLAAAQRPDGGAWTCHTAHNGRKAYKVEQNGCTSSGPRALAILPTLAWQTSEDGVVVNLFTAGTANIRLRDGNAVTIRQETDYPAAGRIKLTVTVPKPTTFGLYVRVPKWSHISHEGGRLKAEPGSYWLLRQTWSRTQTITLDLDLSPRLVVGKGAQGGRVAVVRGPQVLAVDARFNQLLEPLDVVTIASGRLELKTVSGVRDADGLPVYEAEGVVTSDITGYKAGSRTALRFVPFAAAGAEGTPYHIWLTRPSVTAETTSNP